MSRIFTSFLVCALIFSLARSNHCQNPDFRGFKRNLMLNILFSDERRHWPARLLRAAFHDCFAGSCDGSIRFELDRPENVRIDDTLSFLEVSIESTCVNLADALKIGVEVALELSEAQQVSCHNGAVTELAMRENEEGHLPFPNDHPVEIISRFHHHGFTTREALAGNFGGHALGGFMNGGRRFDFTPRINRFSNRFARHAIAIESDDQQFNFLPSDRSLAEQESEIVRLFSHDFREFTSAFRDFTIKMCKM